MSVVQRCPNCGTTRATPGECEACHEAQVRYYCTNHEPGIWLDGRTCPTCDARLGAAARRPPERPSAVRVRAPTAPARAPKPTSPPPLPYTLPDAPAPELDRGAGLERSRLADDVALDELGPPPEPLWQKVLRAVLARSVRPRATPAVATTLGIVGRILKSLLLVAVIVIAAIAGALYLLVREIP